MTDSPEQLQHYLSIARDAAKTAGRILLDWRGQFSVREKGRADLVTDADEASQQAIYNLIHAEFPEHGFLGEEGLNENPHDSDYLWVIDPLDGTSNYVHDFPYYAVSIALQRGDELVVGAIFDPNRSEMFTAIRGQGAFLNKAAIRTSGEENLDQAMAMASLPVGADRSNPAIERFLKALERLQTVQRSGSAALNLACVACGRIDVFWSTNLKPWDVAAGVLLVQEAGGSVTNLEGGPSDIRIPSVIAASSGRIGKDLSSVLN